MATGNTRILIVDDEIHIRNILHRIMEKEGYGVMTAPDGEIALRLIKEEEPDVILLDVMMPGTDGRTVCRKARELSPLSQIVYFTGKVEPIQSSKLEELHSEADAFIAKPATSKQILSKIRRVLQGTR